MNLDSKEDKSVLPTAQGYSKAYAAQDLKSDIRKKYDIKLSIHGITANSPIDVQKELGFDKIIANELVIKNNKITIKNNSIF